MASPVILNGFVREIQAMPELRDCFVGYRGCVGSGGLGSHVLCEQTACVEGAVIIEERIVTDPAINADTERWADAGQTPPNVQPAVVETSPLTSEWVGLGLTCGLTAVSVIGLIASGAAEVPTAGASTFGVALAWTGLLATSAQCGNAIDRIISLYRDPSGKQLEAMDADPIYQDTMLLIDLISITAGLIELPSSVTTLKGIVENKALAQGLTKQELSAMNKAGRGEKISSLVREVGQEPGGMDRIMAAARDAGVTRGLLRQQLQAGNVSVEDATKLSKIIGVELRKRLLRNLSTFWATPAAIAASASPSGLVGSASGSINYSFHLLDGVLFEPSK